MASRQIDLSPIGGRRIGRRRAAWLVVLLAAACALLMAGALEWANRREMVRVFARPLGEIDTAAVRDLTTAMAWQRAHPMPRWPTELLIAVAERHPNSEVAAYALLTASISTFSDEPKKLDLALRAAAAAQPGTRHYAATNYHAARELSSVARSGDAIELLEQAIDDAKPAGRPRLVSGLLRVLAEHRGPEAVLERWEHYVAVFPDLAGEVSALGAVARAHEELGHEAQARLVWSQVLAGAREGTYLKQEAAEALERSEGEAPGDGD